VPRSVRVLPEGVGRGNILLLFLYLYHLYVDLYGKEFADGQVAFGKTLKGLYDYEAAWDGALAMTREERLARLGDVLKVNRK
jgi:hypothetical protein